MRAVFVTLLLLLVTGCMASTGGRSLSFTHPYALDTTPPPGPPIFQQGYTDGCESAISGMGNQFIKVFHDFQYDTTHAKDKVYNRMWDSANNYCRLFLFVYDEHLSTDNFKQYDKPAWFWKE